MFTFEYSDVTTFSLLLTLIHQLFFSCVRLIYTFLLEQIYWRFTGTRQLIHRAKQANADYERAAHVLSIEWRYIFEPTYANSIRDFLLSHHSFTSPDVVLKDNVTLYSIDMDKAIFVEVASNIRVWERECGSFFSEMQYRYATRVIVIYSETVKRLLSRFALNVPRIILISNIGRCGSTLLAQAFECSGRCVAFCEPSVIDTLNANWASTTLSRQQCDRLAENAIKLLCKPVASSESILAYVIKSRASNVALCEHFDRVFGSTCKQLFIYRSMLASAPSLHKLKNRTPLVKLLSICEEIPGFRDYAINQMAAGVQIPIALNIKGPLSFGIYAWILWLCRFRKLRKKNIDIIGVLFEDFLAKPQQVLTEVFKHCQIPLGSVKLATRALQSDAQERSSVSTQALSRFSAVPFSSDLIIQCNKICASFDLPPIDGDCHIEGVIKPM